MLTLIDQLLGQLNANRSAPDVVLGVYFQDRHGGIADYMDAVAAVWGEQTRFLLVAPYNTDPRQWKKLRWTNPYQLGSSYRITTTGQPTDRTARVKTYRGG